LRIEALNFPAGADVSDIIGLPLTGRQSATLVRFARLYAGARVMVLAATDTLALFVAGSFGYLIWARAELNQPIVLYASLSVLIAVFPLIYMLMDLYPGFGLGAVETIRRLSHGTTLGFLLLAATSFAFKLDHLYSRA